MLALETTIYYSQNLMTDLFPLLNHLKINISKFHLHHIFTINKHFIFKVFKKSIR